MAEVDTEMAKAHARKAPTDLVLNFWKQLAKLILENKLIEHGVASNSPICP